MDIQEIEDKLAAARKRLEEISAKLSPKHTDGEMEAYLLARDEVLSLGRELAVARGEEYAVTIDFPVRWSAGAPLPHVLANDWCVFVIFYVAVTDPNWDGTYVKVVQPDDRTTETLAVVEFQRPECIKFGSPNDEVFHGHPLYGKGMEPYRAQIIENSKWISEIEAINKVHDNYDSEHWRKLKHYVLWFHDTTFECLARRYEVEVFQESMGSLMDKVAKRLLK